MVPEPIKIFLPKKLSNDFKLLSGEDRTRRPEAPHGVGPAGLGVSPVGRGSRAGAAWLPRDNRPSPIPAATSRAGDSCVTALEDCSKIAKGAFEIPRLIERVLTHISMPRGVGRRGFCTSGTGADHGQLSSLMADDGDSGCACRRRRLHRHTRASLFLGQWLFRRTRRRTRIRASTPPIQPTMVPS